MGPELLPSRAALAIVWWIGAYALFLGILLVVLAFKMRHMGKELLSPAAAHA